MGGYYSKRAKTYAEPHRQNLKTSRTSQTLARTSPEPCQNLLARTSEPRSVTRGGSGGSGGGWVRFLEVLGSGPEPEVLDSEPKVGPLCQSLPGICKPGSSHSKRFPLPTSLCLCAEASPSAVHCTCTCTCCCDSGWSNLC